VNDRNPIDRHPSEIKRDLVMRRSELEGHLIRLFRRRKPVWSGSQLPEGPAGDTGSVRNGATLPLLPIAGGAALVAFFLLRRRAWPLHLAGRFVQLAAPVVVPILIRRLAGRTD
jgi:hypothetical protein